MSENETACASYSKKWDEKGMAVCNTEALVITRYGRMVAFRIRDKWFLSDSSYCTAFLQGAIWNLKQQNTAWYRSQFNKKNIWLEIFLRWQKNQIWSIILLSHSTSKIWWHKALPQSNECNLHPSIVYSKTGREEILDPKRNEHNRSWT